MDSYGNGYSTVGGKRSADDGAVEESESKKQRCEPSRVVHLRNLHQYVTEQEVRPRGSIVLFGHEVWGFNFTRLFFASFVAPPELHCPLSFPQIIELGSRFGLITNILILKTKTCQAFLELEYEQSAVDMVNYYNSLPSPFQLHGRTIYVQYSSHKVTSHVDYVPLSDVFMVVL